MQASLSVRSDDCGYSQIRSASFVHSSRSRARLTTRLTKLMRYASFASNHRPVIKRSSATPRPTMCGSRWVSPDSAPTFQRRFTTPNFAWSAAIRMSHAIASSMPPARQ